GAACDPEAGHPDRGGPPSGGFEELDGQMALRVLGHPEDRARFRPVEVLHAHPASLARGAHHGSFAGAPSSPATIFSPQGLPGRFLIQGTSEASRTARTRTDLRRVVVADRPTSSGRREAYAARCRPSHPHSERRDEREAPQKGGGLLRVPGPPAMTTADFAPGSRGRRSKIAPSCP